MFEDQGFLYYRHDLLAKENLPVPTTWEQLESEAEQLQKAGLVKYGFVWEGASYEHQRSPGQRLSAGWCRQGVRASFAVRTVRTGRRRRCRPWR
jgi:ABC-type glycerol-3-phosphate transport system substrate-binding protein